MRAGKLRSKISLLMLVQSKNEIGELVDDWQPYAIDVRCDDRVVSSRDNMRNGVELGQEIHTIEMRYRTDIKTEHRVQLQDGRTLAIEGPPRPGGDQKNRSIIVTCVYDGR